MPATIGPDLLSSWLHLPLSSRVSLKNNCIGAIVAVALLTVHHVIHEGGHGALIQQDVVYVLLKMLGGVTRLGLILKLILEFHK